MNENEQRIAIAEFCGWRHDCNNSLGEPCGYLRHIPKIDQSLQLFPDYLSDLNAMHEAEKELSKDMKTWDKYDKTLNEVMDNSHEAADYNWHATAAQRAEALLRTIGKWKSTP